MYKLRKRKIQLESPAYKLRLEKVVTVLRKSKIEGKQINALKQLFTCSFVLARSIVSFPFITVSYWRRVTFEGRSCFVQLVLCWASVVQRADNFYPVDKSLT